MALLLHIETATDICSVALSDGPQLVALQQAEGTFKHASQITLLIQQALQQAALQMQEIDAVAVSSGPGSYTSLRIGTATAKGICYAMDKPLIAVDTLRSLALACLQQEREEGLYFPMIDARRMEVYTAAYDSGNELIQPARALIVEADAFGQQRSAGLQVILCGNGADKCRTVLPDDGILYSSVRCSAAHLIPLALRAFERGDFEDVAYYNPFYLKPPNITTSKKKLL